MRLKNRIHEWLAEHVSWIQYPDWRAEPQQPPLLDQYKRMTGKQRGWFWFFVFWGAVSLLSFFGNQL